MCECTFNESSSCLSVQTLDIPVFTDFDRSVDPTFDKLKSSFDVQTTRLVTVLSQTHTHKHTHTHTKCVYIGLCRLQDSSTQVQHAGNHASLLEHCWCTTAWQSLHHYSNAMLSINRDYWTSTVLHQSNCRHARLHRPASVRCFCGPYSARRV